MTQTQNPISISSQRTIAELVEEVEKLTLEIQELYSQDEIPWIIGISWGKDSSCVLQLIWNAIAALPLEKRKKPIYVITTDTLVENPIVAAWVKTCMGQLKIAAQSQQMPFEPNLLRPADKQTFWVCLMGKGYPSPRRGFRWCTDRMKIQPVNNFIRNKIRVKGEAIVVLGTRKAESSVRAATMKRHEVGRFRDRLSPHANFPNSFVYTPIEDWTTNEVWIYLMQWDNPWGGNNKDLFTLYRGATEDNECPLVVDTSTPSCGDSRFGCWVCTMVNKDKSMEAMIQNDEEKEWLQPLLDIRNDLDLRSDRHRRDFRRIHGNVQLFEKNIGDGETSIEPIPGPYVKKWREIWLRKVLEAQVQVRQNAPEEFKDISLITPEELSEIRRIWLEEKHEFDDSLPRIYQEVTGEVFKDIRLGADEKLLGNDEWEILEEICNDEMHLELMSKLLDTERQFYLRNRRIGIYDSLAKCFDTSSRSKEEAIANAHQKYDLKTAAEQGDVEAVKTKIEELTKTKSNSAVDDDNNQSEEKVTWQSIKFAAK
jgi:DNA sulfur modification protein DndC